MMATLRRRQRYNQTSLNRRLHFIISTTALLFSLSLAGSVAATAFISHPIKTMSPHQILHLVKRAALLPNYHYHPARRRSESALLSSRIPKSLFSSSSLAARDNQNNNEDNSSVSNNKNPDPNEELQVYLRQLALLNDGKTINPRSPRQVSDLLYNNFHEAVNNIDGDK